MNWHRFAWPFVATAMVVAFVSGHWVVAAGILVASGIGAVGLEMWNKRRQ